MSSWTPTERTTIPMSSCRASHGATLPSWSSRVTSTSSPAFSSRASARVSRKLSEVMLWPNATSSPEQPRNEPAFSCARSTSADRAPRRLVRRADVGVVVAQVAGDRVDHLVGALGAAGAVEEGEPPLQRGEARTDGGDVEQGGTQEQFLSVDGPVVVGLHGQRGADEAVALALRDERAQLVGGGRGRRGARRGRRGSRRRRSARPPRAASRRPSRRRSRPARGPARRAW